MKRVSEALFDISAEGKYVFDILQKKGPITKNDLLQITGIKLSTLNRILQPLEDLKLVIETGIGESSGGRRPVLYDINGSKYYMIGIDVSRTYSQVVVTNLKMKILGKRQFAMDETSTPEVTVQMLAKEIDALLQGLNISKEMILGIGVGTVGPLNREKGEILNPENFTAPGWNHVPIRQMLEEALELPAYLDNGANTAAMAEYLFGDGHNYSSIAYFNCGVGIRTGVITSEVIVRTMNNSEDAFAHMIVNVAGEACSCGNYGCIECYSSIHAIVRQFKTALKKGRNSKVNKSLDEIDYMDICMAAEDEDGLAREVLTEAAAIFGAGLANYIQLLNPGMVILSGPLVMNSKFFYQTSRDIALKRLARREGNSTVFSKGGFFGDHAISTGAAAMVVECILNTRISL